MNNDFATRDEVQAAYTPIRQAIPRITSHAIPTCKPQDFARAAKQAPDRA